MIELFAANTPNGKKISIMLEEIGYKYKTTKVDLDKGEQFKLHFKKISPLSKIPVIIDHKKNKTVFESGAILMYLAEESGMFYESRNKLEIDQWLMAQMGYIGPMLGQHHQFHYYNPGKSKFGEERYFKIAKRIYSELDERLSNSKFLSGADLIQLYTGMVFKGPNIVNIIKNDLSELLLKDGVKNFTEIVGNKTNN